MSTKSTLITRDSFDRLVDDFVLKSDHLNDGWEVKRTHGYKYICKKSSQCLERKIENNPNNMCIDFDQDPSSSDHVSGVSESTVYTFDYHIVFSDSYSVPVLYFNVYTCSGSLLPLDDVWGHVPEYYRARLAEDRWTFLTQAEHPYLGRPFYHLHPCHTDKLLGAISAIDVSSDGRSGGPTNYLVSWLCAVGPVVRLNVPMEYGHFPDKYPSKMPIQKESYGKTSDGQDINMYVMKNMNNIEVGILDYGGIVASIFVPDKDGNFADVILGFDKYKDGYDTNPPYFGCIVGRYANRIAKGHFTLDGVTYNLTVNNGPNALHGGTKGFDKRLWSGKVDGDMLVLTYTSADDEEHYPGEVKVTVTYQLTDQNELVINYSAITSKTTVINLTNHAYFNLAGHKTNNLSGHTIRMDADSYTPVDSTSIPTGAIDSVTGTKFDLTSDTDLTQRIAEVPGGIGFDHNFVLGKPGWDKHVARVTHGPSGRQLDMYSTEPGVQFYTAYYLNVTNGKMGSTYSKWGAFCLEAQHYPDSPNQPTFPTTVLNPGETYRQTTKYVFSVAES